MTDQEMHHLVLECLEQGREKYLEEALRKRVIEIDDDIEVGMEIQDRMCVSSIIMLIWIRLKPCSLYEIIFTKCMVSWNRWAN